MKTKVFNINKTTTILERFKNKCVEDIYPQKVVDAQIKRFSKKSLDKLF